jgi:Tfp pilus assembly protein PilF
MSDREDEKGNTQTILVSLECGITAGLLLALLVLILYMPVTRYDFIALDDHSYVLENPNILRGITAQNLLWALTTFDTTNWHPLTWFSYLVDAELFGLNPGGYHLTNLLFHLLNTILLFFVLHRMTGAGGKSFWVAALFALHPLNMESVVWIAERKNLLSTFFGLLTLFAYIRYLERREVVRYLQVLICFTLGLMSKPMLVTLPFMLLLLDYWPLQRFSARIVVSDGHGAKDRIERRMFLILIREKLPLLVMAVFSAGITLYAAQSGGALKSTAVFPLLGRICNALLSYTLYLLKMIYPANLAIYYPYPAARPAWQVAGAALAFLLTGIAAFRMRWKFRPFTFGWLWYVIALLPVIGLVQVGFQSMANRYAYLPLIGIFVLVAWGVPELVKGSLFRHCLPAVAGMILAVSAFSTWTQLPHWRNSEAVFAQALKVTKDNPVAETGMGDVWRARGHLSKAMDHYREALRIKPDYAVARNNLALVLLRLGKWEEAENQCREAMQGDPHSAEIRNTLGVALARQGEYREAEGYFLEALTLKSDYTAARGNLDALRKQALKTLDHNSQ